MQIHQPLHLALFAGSHPDAENRHPGFSNKHQVVTVYFFSRTVELNPSFFVSLNRKCA
jgi:hypothetical protein